jgi:NAD(P)-dependent dehydrogenase (short-subunit alcohol dehydrogenase family)
MSGYVERLSVGGRKALEKFWNDLARYDPFVAKVPPGRTGKPIEVADLILFLASSASDLITGDNIMIDGGYAAL